jgi:hypothetical protein
MASIAAVFVRGRHPAPEAFALSVEAQRYASAPPTLAMTVELRVGADGVLRMLEGDHHPSRCQSPES